MTPGLLSPRIGKISSGYYLPSVTPLLSSYFGKLSCCIEVTVSFGQETSKCYMVGWLQHLPRRPVFNYQFQKKEQGEIICNLSSIFEMEQLSQRISELLSTVA